MNERSIVDVRAGAERSRFFVEADGRSRVRFMRRERTQ